MTVLGFSLLNLCRLKLYDLHCAHIKGVEDRFQHGRGVALADFNGDGKTDIVYGNWNGPHRLYLQTSDSKFRVGEERGSR